MTAPAESSAAQQRISSGVVMKQNLGGTFMQGSYQDIEGSKGLYEGKIERYRNVKGYAGRKRL